MSSTNSIPPSKPLGLPNVASHAAEFLYGLGSASSQAAGKHPPILPAAASVLLALAFSMLFAAGEVAPRGSEPAPVRVAALQSDIKPAGPSQQATTLLTNGIRSGQSLFLEEAVQAFEKSLDGSGGVSDPATKAWTENQLALARKHLAAVRKDDGLLLQAIAGYHRALTYFNGAFDKQNAGIVSANLLAALLQIKDRDAAQVSTAELQSLGNAALAVTDRQTAPLDWARLQLEIGTLTFAIGARHDDTAAVERAIAAFRAGLQGAQTDGRPPREWAEAENLLANALEYLGERQGSQTLLGQALQALNNTWTLYQYAGLDQYQFYLESRISALTSRMGADGNAAAVSDASPASPATPPPTQAP